MDGNQKSKVSSNIAQKDYFSELLKVVHLICLFALGFPIYVCVEKYLSVPTIFETKNLNQSLARFPDITLCSNVKGGIRGKVLEVIT